MTTAITVISKRIGDSALHVSSDNTIELAATDIPAGNLEVQGIWLMLARLWKNHPHLNQGKLAIITDMELGKVKLGTIGPSRSMAVTTCLGCCWR